MIAKELGVHFEVVKRNRKRLGIALYSEQINWDKVDFSLSNKTLSEIYNIGTKEIARRRVARINWHTLPLGKVPDVKIAQQLQIHSRTIGKKRKELDIPKYDPLGIQTIDWSSAGLGEKPDTFIAEKLNLKSEVVRRKRNQLKINPFRGMILTQERLSCRSILEAKYDAYLHWKKIGHEHEVPVPGSNYVADFLIGNQYIEIAGMLGFSKYIANYLKKEKWYKENNINVKWLYPNDVNQFFENCPVEIIFKEMYCEVCNKLTKKLIKNMCKKCYIKHKNKKNNCLTCSKPCFHKFCNSQCFGKSLKKDIDMNYVNTLLAKNYSLSKISKLVNVTSETLSTRLSKTTLVQLTQNRKVFANSAIIEAIRDLKKEIDMNYVSNLLEKNYSVYKISKLIKVTSSSIYRRLSKIKNKTA